MARRTRRRSYACDACQAPSPDHYGVPDPCLGQLPGAANACCGHGHRALCYVQEPDRTLRGDEAFARLIELGGSPAPLTGDGMGRGPLRGWHEV